MLRCIEGFDHFNSGDLANKWAAVTSGGGVAITSLAARNGSGGVRFTSNGGTSGSNAHPLAANFMSQGTIIFGFAFRMSALPTGTNRCFIASGTANNASPSSFSENVRVYVDTNGKIGLQVSTTVIDSGFTGTPIGVNEWHYLEVKLKASSSTASGDCQIYLDGTLVNGVLTGKNTATFASTFSGISVGLAGSTNNTIASGQTLDIDDLYILDTTGTANNTFLGDCTVETLFVTGDGASGQWTPNGGLTNSSRVEENPEDGDTTYVSTTGVGNRDSYTMGDLAETPNAIYGVQAVAFARTDGTNTFNASIRTSSTYSDGATATLAANYKAYRALFETDAGGASWTKTSVNAMEAGVKLDS